MFSFRRLVASLALVVSTMMGMAFFAVPSASAATGACDMGTWFNYSITYNGSDQVKADMDNINLCTDAQGQSIYRGDSKPANCTVSISSSQISWCNLSGNTIGMNFTITVNNSTYDCYARQKLYTAHSGTTDTWYVRNDLNSGPWGSCTLHH